MDPKSRLFKILSIVCILSMMLAFLSTPSAKPVQAASTVIDSFNDDWSLETTTSASQSVSTTSALGGRRNVTLSVTNNPETNTLLASTSATTGRLSNSLGAGVTGTTTINYDGSTGTTLVYNGLSPAVDLSNGNVDQFIYMLLTTDDVPLNITIKFYTNDVNHCSTLTRKIPGSIYTTSVPRPVIFGFSKFAKCGTGAGTYTATRSNVTAIQVIINGVEDADITIDMIATGSADFGDADDTGTTNAIYYTKMTEMKDEFGVFNGIVMGAGHILTSGTPLLGSTIDSETDGQPSASADGDDLHGIDDENGVTQEGVWGAGYTVGGSVSVVTNGVDGCLYGWIDWNLDGAFDNALSTSGNLDTTLDDTVQGDRVLDGKVISASTTTYYYSFPIPADADPGASFYARFRIYPRDSDNSCSTFAGGSYPKYPNGYITYGGEVEDYYWAFKTTAVTTTNFHSRVANQPVGLQLQWTTTTEADTVGFNIYRAVQPGGSYIKINPALIPAHTPGEASGGDYSYTDTDAMPRVQYSYRLAHVAADLSETDSGTADGVYSVVYMPISIR